MSMKKEKKIYNWLLEYKFDIILLQETHFIQKYEEKYNFDWKGNSFHAFSDSVHSRGVSILIKNGLDLKILNVNKSNDGRKIIMNIVLNDRTFTIVNVYAPNDTQNRIDFFKRLNSFIRKHNPCENIILSGDFNCHLGTCNEQDKSIRYLNDIINQLDLVDAWKLKHPTLTGFTWCNATNTPTSRIDFIFVSNNLSYMLHKINVRKIPGTHSGKRMSDHRFLKIHFKTCQLRKQGFDSIS